MSKKKILMKTSLALATAVGMFSATPMMTGDLNAKEEIVSTQPSATLKEGSSYNKVGMSMQLNETQSVGITLQNDMFQGLKANQDVTSWFKDMPKGLKATVQDNGYMHLKSAFHQIVFSGTPEEIYYGKIEAVIPKEYLQSGKDLEVTTDTVFEIARYNVEFDMLEDIKQLDRGTRIIKVPVGDYRIIYRKVNGEIVHKPFTQDYMLMEEGAYQDRWEFTKMEKVGKEYQFTFVEDNDRYGILLEGGSAYDETGKEIVSAAPGTKVTVKCSDPDAVFYGWKSLDYALPEYDIENVDQAEATFIMPKSFVKLEADYGRRVDVIDGKVKKGDVEIQDAKPNELLTLYADEKPGYKFSHWAIEKGRANIEDITKPVTGLYVGYKSVVIKAVYEKIPVVLYPITVESNGNGSASASVKRAESGNQITLDASAEDGYHFKEWQVIKGNIAIVDNTFTMPEEEVVINAIFEKDEEQIETAAFEITNISKLEHTIGDPEALTIDVSIPMEKEISLKIDGVDIAGTAYQIAANQMQLSVTPTFLDTLSAGTHTIQILHGDETANFDISIKEEVKDEANDETKEEVSDKVTDEKNEDKDQVETETEKEKTENETMIDGKNKDTKPNNNTDHVIKNTARQSKDIAYLAAGALILGGLLFVKRKKKVRS